MGMRIVRLLLVGCLTPKQHASVSQFIFFCTLPSPSSISGCCCFFSFLLCFLLFSFSFFVLLPFHTRPLHHHHHQCHCYKMTSKPCFEPNLLYAACLTYTFHLIVVVISWLIWCPSSTHSVSLGQIYSDKCTCSHTKMQVANQTWFLTPSQYTDTWMIIPGSDPVMPGAWQDGGH